MLEKVSRDLSTDAIHKIDQRKPRNAMARSTSYAAKLLSLLIEQSLGFITVAMFGCGEPVTLIAASKRLGQVGGRQGTWQWLPRNRIGSELRCQQFGCTHVPQSIFIPTTFDKAYNIPYSKETLEDPNCPV